MTSVPTLALQVLLPGFEGPDLSPEAAELFDEGLAGLCLFGSNHGPSGFAPLVDAVRRIAPGAVVAVDEEGGDVTRLHAATGSPVMGHAALGAVDDLGLTRATATAIGTELAALGVNLDLGPVADVNSNPGNPVIGVRSFGSEPALVARHVTAYVEGLRASGVAACAKHFPGHGDTNVDSHLALPRVEASLEVLRIRELVPFVAAVDAGVDAVMTSHLVVSAIDDRPATLSPLVLRLLRDELGFEGVIVSDALDMEGASAVLGIPGAAVAALQAGCDLLCLGPDKDVALVRATQAAIVEAVAGGDLAEERLRDAASRVAAIRRPPDVATQVRVGDEQLAGARAALHVSGSIPDLAGALLVRVQKGASIAVGDAVPWALPSSAVDPEGFECDRTVILQVRDAHRHPDVLALVRRLPSVVVVEYGWPGPWDDEVPRVCTQGASLPSQAAVAELLETNGWRG